MNAYITAVKLEKISDTLKGFYQKLFSIAIVVDIFFPGERIAKIVIIVSAILFAIVYILEAITKEFYTIYAESMVLEFKNLENESPSQIDDEIYFDQPSSFRKDL